MGIPEGSIRGWKIDDVLFIDYGVYVAKSIGVFDTPSIVDNSINWLDENGNDYWQADHDVKYHDRDIVLSCWIRATGFNGFKTKLNAFIQSLSLPGNRILETPFGNTFEVSFMDGIDISMVTRYVETLQIGVFTLKLTVKGDDLYKYITVYRADDEEQGLFPYGNEAKFVSQLQQDQSISLIGEFNSKQTFGRSDYILYNGQKYISFEYPQIEKVSTNKFVYRVTYSHQSFYLKDVLFMMLEYPEKPFWGTMEDIVDLIITNANRVHPNLFVKGVIEETEYKNHSFVNQNCHDVLSSVAHAYDLEFDIKQYYTALRITVVKKIGYESLVTFEYGKDNNLYTISRVSAGRETMITRLYAYGSDKNIPASYRNGFPRLRLEFEPLTKDYYGMKIERVKVWDEIFPEYVGTVTSYTYTPSSDPVNKPELAKYEMTDTSMPFDLKESVNGNTTYLIGGTRAKVHFNSGSLAGFEFEVLDYDHSLKKFSIVPIKEKEMYIPNATLHPSADDEFVILDIMLPQSYIDIAEERLRVAAQAEIDEYYNPKGTYTIQTSGKVDFNELACGDMVTLIDPDFGENGLFRINELSVNIYNNETTLVLGTYSTKPKIKSIELAVKQLEKIVSNANLTDVNTVKGNEQTTQEIKYEIFDPIDNRFRAGSVVRNESIDPRMLAYDAGIIQYFIRDGLVETNVDGDEDVVNVGHGDISITNWRNSVMDRDGIKNAQDYNPTRTWLFPESTHTLNSKDTHFVYAKVDLSSDESTDCVIEMFPDHKEVKELFEEEGTSYLIYKLGYISKGEL